MSFIRFIFMGSEVSSGGRQSPEMELSPVSTEAMIDSGCTLQQQQGKPARSVLYSETFYCPLVSSNDGFGNGNFSKCTEVEVVEASSSRLVNPEEFQPKLEEMPMEVDENMLKDEKQSASRIEDNHGENQSNPSAEPVIEDKLEEVNASVGEAESKSTFGFYQPESVDIASVEGKDVSTSTSPPTYNHAAAGNSQPIMVDCATGMSQPLEDLVECGIQTSQELLLPKPAVSKNMMEAPKKEDKPASTGYIVTSTTKRAPIVFPRVCGQTTAPEIPVKIPRLDELDNYGKQAVKASIYSSDVTFEFDEADKENDSSVLRQRGKMGQCMRDPLEDASYSDNKPKLANYSAVPSYAPLALLSNRGPFLRVGLSKKSKTRRPLHPRVYDAENEDFEN